MPSSSAPPPSPPPPSAGEVIHRPDPGLARGVWEASPGALYVALGAVLLGAAVYLGARLGLFRRKRGK